MIVGLTGGIASGKTTCSNWFAAQGIPIIDADIIAREIVQPNQPTLMQLSQVLGKKILNPDGSLDRVQLRQMMFKNAQIKAIVNDIMHPAIRELGQRQLIAAEKKSPIVIYSVPLLFENGLEQQCQATIVVDIPESEQIIRGSQRDGVTTDDLKRIIKSQISREKRLTKANYIVNNHHSLENTKQQCQNILTLLLQFSSLF